ncbi:HTH domain-containing protein [Aliishimia ponticola]|uniref:HTH domain-containing protein n=1 Tax=Aliishimia ponticola TaxID=2499833 RepID=A0A4S4NKH1_9RHOB|nr:HTH domain-containing protein [Aliishimia ponticola]THH38798.1 HTH domain-containing protein [Aliishimia ponticola]
MTRTQRLHRLLSLLRDGAVHTAADLAAQVGVSVRTIYRDMDTLQASGVPIEGARGTGYRATGEITLPPLTLTPQELEALNLGIAIVAEAADPDLASAAASLGDKLDGLLPEQVISDTDAWKFATYPFADSARGLGHMPTLRSAIRARQKLRLRITTPDGQSADRIARPLRIENWGRVWLLTIWCETTSAFDTLRLDLIDAAVALPELFTDEPGKTLDDLPPGTGQQG